MNTQAETSHEHAVRIPRRRTPPPTSRLSSKPNHRILVLPLLALTSLASLTRAVSPRAALSLNLPHVPATCDTLNLTWTGGTANYTLLITQAHSSTALQSWTALANTSVLWTVRACGGTDLSLTLADARGYRSAVSFAVQFGSDGSCLSASQRASTAGCVLPASATTTRTSTISAKSTANTNTGGSTAKGPKLATVVGVVVGVVVLLALWLSCVFTRRRQRRGVGVLGPDSRPYFVRHERGRARRRDTLLEMPPPVYEDAGANANANERHTPDHPSNTSLSHSASVVDYDQTRPLMHMPEPETVQMAQLPRGRIEPELLPTPFVSPYEGSVTPASSEGPEHARGQTSTPHAPGTYPFYPYHPYLNHRWAVGALPYSHHQWTAVPQTYNHHSAAAPPNHQVVTQASAPEVIYSTPRPAAQSYTTTYPQPRGVLVDTYKASAQNPNWNRTYAPSQNHTHTPYSTTVFSPSRPVPVYDTEYIRSLNWATLGPHSPLAPARRRGSPPQAPVQGPARRSRRIAFDLTRRILRKEGVPLSFLLQEDVRTLKRLVARPYNRVLPRSGSGGDCGGAWTITLRFWSPIHPYPVQEYKVAIDPSGHYMTRLALALHVAKAYRLYFKAAACAPVPTRSKSALKTTVLEPRTVSMGHLWLVSLRETEREGVYDVGVQNHGPRASCVW
ncbi:hypothetical protein V8D89_010584 [Ganoderma adspersum]